jgi:hypothetical protein
MRIASVHEPSDRRARPHRCPPAPLLGGGLVPRPVWADAGPVPEPEPEEPHRYRSLPEPVQPEDLVETVDVSEHHGWESESDERARMLRTAGAP